MQSLKPKTQTTDSKFSELQKLCKLEFRSDNLRLRDYFLDTILIVCFILTSNYHATTDAKHYLRIPKVKNPIFTTY